jgi:hypothetical protein
MIQVTKFDLLYPRKRFPCRFINSVTTSTQIQQGKKRIGQQHKHIQAKRTEVVHVNSIRLQGAYAPSTKKNILKFQKILTEDSTCKSS